MGRCKRESGERTTFADEVASRRAWVIARNCNDCQEKKQLQISHYLKHLGLFNTASSHPMTIPLASSMHSKYLSLPGGIFCDQNCWFVRLSSLSLLQSLMSRATRSDRWSAYKTLFFTANSLFPSIFRKPNLIGLEGSELSKT